MASPANKKTSSSPPIPNRPNPKPRNSEAGDPMRRSFGGNPFPTNSRVNIPSDMSRRNSFGGREDKENETKPIQTPKTSKHFMSPTISAASKINPSPRKKVLSDKNELPRSEVVKGLILEQDTKTHRIVSKSCVSFSDVVHEIVDIDVEENKKFEGSSHDDMTVTDFDHENEVHEEEEKKGIVYSDPRFMISPRSSVPYTSPEFAASGEVDTLAPYDPKKNFLSPRPQFLHYRPNPRIEKHFDECKQLEELFISEGSSSSDTELSVEESANSEEQEEVASHEAEAVVEEEETVEQLEAESDEEMVCESVEETSQVPKQSGSRKFKFLGLFLALALGYMLVSGTLSPPIDLLKESPFYEFHIPREVTEFAKANNLEKLSEKLWTLTESTLVIVDKLVSRLGGGTEEYGPLKFHNLTYNLEDYSVFQQASVVINEVPLQEKTRGGNNLEDGGYDNEIAEEIGGEEISEDGDAESNEFDEETEVESGTDIELSEGEGNLEALFEDGFELNIEEHKESDVNPEEKLETGSTRKDQEEELEEAVYINLHDVESAAINVHQQKESEVAGAEVGSEEGLEEIAVEAIDDLHLQMQQSEVSDAVSGSEEGIEEIVSETSDDLLHPKLQQSEVAVAESGSSEGLGEVAAETSNDLYPKADAESVSEEGFGDDVAAETSEDLHPKVRSFVKEMIVLASTVLVLLAGVGFLFAKKTKPVSASAPKQAPESKELNLSHLPVENLMKEQLSSSSLNFQEEEVDDRVSKISFHSNNKDSQEHQSEGGGKKSNGSRNLRRESMASSASEYSVGSFSYGSFTTYEKIPIKSGDREEEMITPVRRSSRLRNHKL